MNGEQVAHKHEVPQGRWDQSTAPEAYAEEVPEKDVELDNMLKWDEGPAH